VARQFQKSVTAVHQACYRARLELRTILRELGVDMEPHEDRAS
jgi:hypothetical protein